MIDEGGVNGTNYARQMDLTRMAPPLILGPLQESWGSLWGRPGIVTYG